MITDGKHTERVTIWLTEHEFKDLACMAESEDRKLSDMARWAVRHYLYGSLRAAGCDVDGANRDQASAKASHDR